MCGILSSQNAKINEINFKNALYLLTHRGPDNLSYYQISNDLYFGHSRLSILDLSENANQPMYFNNLYLIYNGEIYNYYELKSLLESKNIILKTKSDTEILIKLYDLMGYECVKLINGMFAFVIFDAKKNEVVFCRDRFGIKPLYMYNENDILILSSEIKPILNIINNCEFNYKKLSSFMCTNFLFGNETLFKNIEVVTPGIIFVYKNKKLKTKYKFDDHISQHFLSEIKKIIKNDNENEIIEFTEYLLNNSIHSQIISDVPISVFLSSGIDSGLIAYYLYKNLSYKINSFSFANPNSIDDESVFSTKYANQLGFKHTNISLDYDSEFNSLYEKTLYHFEFPIAYPSSIPLFKLSQEASKYNKVVLTGEGGDELMAGYNKYLNLNKPLYKLYYLLTSLIYGKKLSTERIGYKLSIYNKRIKDLFQTDFVTYNPIKGIGSDLINNILLFDQKNYLQGMLHKTDRMTMANSLEARVPYLDNYFSIFCNMLPSKYKLRNNTKKYLLRKIGQKYLPNDYLLAPKRGFPFKFIEQYLNKRKKEINFWFI